MNVHVQMRVLVRVEPIPLQTSHSLAHTSLKRKERKGCLGFKGIQLALLPGLCV